MGRGRGARSFARDPIATYQHAYQSYLLSQSGYVLNLVLHLYNSILLKVLVRTKFSTSKINISHMVLDGIRIRDDRADTRSDWISHTKFSIHEYRYLYISIFSTIL